MVCCGFISSFIGLKLVVLYPCDFAVDGVKGWNGYEIDTTYKKKNKRFSQLPFHTVMLITAMRASQAGQTARSMASVCSILFTLSTAS